MCARHLFNSIFIYGEMSDELTLYAESAMMKEPGGFLQMRRSRFQMSKLLPNTVCVPSASFHGELFGELVDCFFCPD